MNSASRELRTAIECILQIVGAQRKQKAEERLERRNAFICNAPSPG
jgi:hypothetical protein